MADERDELDEVLEGVRLNNGSHEDQGSGGFNPETVLKACIIRVRERKLAELAREMHEWLVIQNDLSPIDRDWLRRYEETVK